MKQVVGLLPSPRPTVIDMDNPFSHPHLDKSGNWSLAPPLRRGIRFRMEPETLALKLVAERGSCTHLSRL